jgi:hypothetical protein
MHRLEANIMHHAKKRREQRKYKLNNNTWERIDTEPSNYKHSIKLYNDDLTTKGIGYY